MTEQPALSAVGLERRFGSVRAVAGLDLEVRPGELYGLIGPDGAGKTTAIRCLVGLLPLHGGSVQILGQDPARSRSVREKLGYMPQAYSLYADLTVAENLRFFGRLFVLPRAEFQDRSRRLLEITRLAAFADRKAGALSGGMYKKLALACALLHRPQVLLLDEPTNGVDPVSRRELWTLLGEFTGQGMAVLLSTPYMDEAERCHRVGLQHRGRLLAEGPPEELLAQLPHPVFRVRGQLDRPARETLDACSAILARSPEGSSPRVVVRAGTEETTRRTLARVGLSLEPAEPWFEDLFLSLLREEEG